MLITTKSLRAVLHGNLTDFSNSCAIEGLVDPSNLAALVVLLANYREEGQDLHPEIYIFQDVTQAIRMLPGSDIVFLGDHSDPKRIFPEAVKKAAPLARSGWCIFIENKKNKKFSYGVFRGSLNPLKISLDKTFFSEPNDSFSVVRICQTAMNCLELKNTNGEIFHLLLNDKPENSPPPNEHLQKLVEKICAKTPRKIKDTAKNYIFNLLNVALSESHGSLIAVTSSTIVPNSLKDGSILEKPIDFPKIIEALFSESEKLEHEHKLNAYKQLVIGMISSDGIVVFDSKARLLAFNCFITPLTQPLGIKIHGGARTRAFEALSQLVGSDLTTAFVRSQDGWTKIRNN